MVTTIQLSVSSSAEKKRKEKREKFTGQYTADLLLVKLFVDICHTIMQSRLEVPCGFRCGTLNRSIVSNGVTEVRCSINSRIFDMRAPHAGFFFFFFLIWLQHDCLRCCDLKANYYDRLWPGLWMPPDLASSTYSRENLYIFSFNFPAVPVDRILSLKMAILFPLPNSKLTPYSIGL